MIGRDLFWLAPLLPLAAFALLACGLGRTGRLAAGVAVAALTGSTLVSALALAAAADGERRVVAVRWLAVGGRRLDLALGLDPLGALAAALVAVVGLVVFVYAASYMADDPYRGRFFAELSLFAGAMLVLVLAADLLTLFIAWELVGLCSYLLIGFWFERPGVPAAATKAFLTTRMGDLAMLAGVLLVVGAAGRGRIDAALAAAGDGRIDGHILTAAALLLVAGAAGKSAQVPFQGWLPDAMAGPTPVSALLHSATMVAAGVFLIARLYPLFRAADPALAVIAWTGAATALLGALAALVQTDLKRTLAYSTMSQLGLMFVGLGAGSLLAGVLLLAGQALYKAQLFLVAGAVDHTVGGTAYERMGGLARRMPASFVAFAVGAAALAGLPVTLALPPKDPALAAAWDTNRALFAVALLASLGTALYSARMLGLVFLGRPSPTAREAQEARPGLLGPILVLAALVVAGLLANAALLGRPLGRLLDLETPESAVITVLALGVAVAGASLSLWARAVWPVLRPVRAALAAELGLVSLYRGAARGGLALARMLGALDRGVFDPIATWAVTGTRWAVRAAGVMDRAVFDALAAAAARGTLAFIRAGARFDLRRLDAAFTTIGRATLALGQRVRRLQTGRIENYLLLVCLWGLGIIAVAAAAVVGR